MNFYAFSELIVFLSCVLTAAFVYWKNPRGEKNRLFVALALAGAMWSFFYVLWQMATYPGEALLWIRLSVIGAALIPAINVHIMLKVLDLETPRRMVLIKIWYAITFLIIATAGTPYFIPRVEPRAGFPFWPVPGPVVDFLFVFQLIPSAGVLMLIREKGMASSSLMRNKLKWLLVAILIGWGGGLSNNFLWYKIPIKPYPTMLSSMGVIGVALTFFRPAIVDFNFLMKKTSMLVLEFVLTALICGILLIPFLFHGHPLFLALLAILGGALVHPIVKKWFQRSTLVAKTNREKIKESTYTYNDLAQNIVDLTMNTIPVEMTSVYFYDTLKLDFYLCAQRGMKNEMVRNLRFNRSVLALTDNDPLIKRIQRDQQALNLDRLLNEMNEGDDKSVVDNLRKIEAEICEPLIFGGKLRGLLVVGKKKNGALFNDEELEMMDSYAQMGTEVMRTIMAMETELSQTSLYSHDINHDIRSITQTLEFLKSPMARSQPEEKVLNLVTQAEKVAGHLYEWFQDNRDRSAMIMKTIRGEYAKEPVKLSDIVKISTGKFTLQAEKAGVAYKVDIEPYVEPFQGNETDLTRVIDNLISNALRHLPEQGGQLTITSRRKDSNYEIVVKDNGEGIEPENLEKIWQMGWQGKDSKKGSAGFGLSIVKQIVQIHGGTIQAYSEGKRKGTEFNIVFPVTTKL